MEVFEAMVGRRSVRKYETRRVPDNIVEKLLEAARWAPSGGNTQPWRFVVVRDEVAKKMLRAISPGLSGKPSVIIVVCVDFGTEPDETETIKILDIGAAVQNLLIAAHALGLGACWVGSANWRGVKETVGIPEHSSIDPISLVSIGYPAETPKPRARRPIEEIVFERFETAWNKSV
jgi:nitroreductase